MKQKLVVRQTLALPKDAADFLDQQAAYHFTSRNAEIVRSIRERMQATTERVSQASSSVVAPSHAGACNAGQFHQQHEEC